MHPEGEEDNTKNPGQIPGKSVCDSAGLELLIRLPKRFGCETLFRPARSCPKGRESSRLQVPYARTQRCAVRGSQDLPLWGHRGGCGCLGARRCGAISSLGKPP